jgi:hypothetical protein
MLIGDNWFMLLCWVTLLSRPHVKKITVGLSILTGHTHTLDETMILSRVAAADLICSFQIFCPPLTFSCLKHYIVG